MAEYKVILNDDAEEGLKKGVYEFTPGGIRNVETKKIVQLFRPTGEKVIEGNTSIPQVQMAVGIGMEESNKLMKKADRVLAEVQKCAELSWEASVIGYLNYNMSIQGFAEMARKLDILQNTIEYNRLQDKKESYARHYMNLKDLLTYLTEEDPEIPIYEISKTLSEIAAFINGVFEEYKSGKMQPESAIKMLISLIVPFVRCAEECCLLCQFKGKAAPPSYSEWMAIVENILSSDVIKRDLRKMAYINMPLLTTTELEFAAKLPMKTVKHLRIEAKEIRNFVVTSGLTRTEYLNFPREMKKRFLLGDYTKGEIISDASDF